MLFATELTLATACNIHYIHVRIYIYVVFIYECLIKQGTFSIKWGASKVLFLPWPGGISTFPPRDHNLSFGKVKESFAAVDIDITFRTRAKGRGFGLEQDQVQPTPKSHTSIWDHKNHSHDTWTYIYSTWNWIIRHFFLMKKMKWKPDDASNSNNNINQSINC